MLLLSVIVYIVTDRGTLVIKADNKFATSLKGREITIRDKESTRQFRVTIGERHLPSGEYWISVEDNQGLKFSTDRFSITRGGKEVLVVTIEPAKPRPIRVGASDRSRPMVTGLPPLALVSAPTKLKGVRWWTMETRLHRGEIFDLAASPDGKLLATASVDGTVRLWTMQPFALKRILLKHADQVRSLAWSTDGKTLATGGLDRTVVLWNIADGTVSEELQVGRFVSQLGWSPDGKWLALITSDRDSDRAVQIWEVGKQKLHCD